MRNTIIQLFSMLLIMGFGYFLRKKKYLSPSTIKELSHFTINWLFPASFFVSTLSIDVKQVLNGTYILALVLSLVLTYLLSALVARLVCKDKKQRVAITLIIYVANFVVISVPMVSTVMGETYVHYATLALFIALFFHNIIPIMSLERVTGSKESFGRLLLNVFKNPIVMSILIAGILNVAFGFQLPDFLERPLSQLGRLAPTIVLLCIGNNMNFSIDKKRVGEIVAATVTSLILVPLLVWGICAAVGLPADLTKMMIILFAAPSAPYIYNIMSGYDLKLDVVQHIIVVTMLGYMLTMPAIMYLMTNYL